MLQPADARTSGRLASTAASPARVPGVDRVLWVRVELHGGRASSGVVHGVRHRRPVDVAVSADVADRLVRAGVPALRHEAGAGRR